MCAPCWFYLQDYTRMQGQQNIKLDDHVATELRIGLRLYPAVCRCINHSAGIVESLAFR